jgi:hypothetical protein
MPKKKSENHEVSHGINISGAESLHGRKWIRVRQGENVVTFPRSEVMKNPYNVKCLLADNEIFIVGQDYAKFLKNLQKPRPYPRRNILEQPGWTTSCFALQDGQVFAPNDENAYAVFDVDPQKCSSSGTLEEWLTYVAGPLAGQPVAMFMMMAMFVAPILKLTHRSGNFGIELVGPRGKGKSTLLQLIATVIGGGMDDPSTRYWNSCDTTINALEQKAERHSDLPLLLDDATNFSAEDSGAKRGHKFKAFIFKLAQAETRDRMGGGKQRAFRTMYILTSNLPLNEVIGEVAEREAGATADRLLTLDVSLQEYGIFEFLPEGYSDATEYARALVEAMAAYYGTSMPHFLHGLVNHKAKDEVKLCRGIRKRADRFIERANVDRNDGSAVRVAEAFGLVMAAGQLAQKYGALPADYDCEGAAVGAYRLFLASTKRVSHQDRLSAYASDPAVLDMEALGLRYVTRSQLAEAAGFIRPHRDGHREFVVSSETFKRVFPDWRSLLRDPEVGAYLQSEGPRGKRKQVKREMRKGRPNDRFFCFRLPKTFAGPEA